jgi:hypothetical protein
VLAGEGPRGWEREGKCATTRRRGCTRKGEGKTGRKVEGASECTRERVHERRRGRGRAQGRWRA